MDRKHRDILITKRCELLENLNVGDGLFTELISRKILSPRMVRKIKNGKSEDEQAEDLLDILPTRGPLCFKEFCESLKANDQEHIVSLYLTPEKIAECAVTPVEGARGQKRPRTPSPDKTHDLVCFKDRINEKDIVLKILSSYTEKGQVTNAERKQFVPNEHRYSMKHFTISPPGVEERPRYIPVDQITDSSNGYHRHRTSHQNDPYFRHQRHISKGNDSHEIRGRSHDAYPRRINAVGSGNIQLSRVIDTERGSGQSDCHSAIGRVQLNTVIDTERGSGQNEFHSTHGRVQLNTRTEHESRVNNIHSDIDYNQKNTSSDLSELYSKGRGYECQSSVRCGLNDNLTSQPGTSCTETNSTYTPNLNQSCSISDNKDLNIQRDSQGIQTRLTPKRSPLRVISPFPHHELLQENQEFSLGHHHEHRINHQSSLEHHTNHQSRLEHHNCNQSSLEHHNSNHSSLEPHTNHQTSIEHQASHQLSLEHRTNNRSSLEHHTNHQSSLEHLNSHQSSLEHLTNHQSSLEHQNSHQSNSEQCSPHSNRHQSNREHHIDNPFTNVTPQSHQGNTMSSSLPHNLEGSLRRLPQSHQGRTNQQPIPSSLPHNLQGSHGSSEKRNSLAVHSCGQSSSSPDIVRRHREVQSNSDPLHCESFHRQCTETLPPVSPDRVTRCDSIDNNVPPRLAPEPRHNSTEVLKSKENLTQQVLVDNMADNDIDLTDGPVQVRVELSTREFYLENYRQAYPMKKIPRGEALIINVNKIQGKPPRLGTDIDRDNMHMLLLQLHFDVTVYNDEDGLTAGELFEKITAFAGSDKHRNSNACFVCLLSHGEEGYIYGTDGKTVPLSHIFSLFDNNKCKDLCEKPKIFIIQACRGDSFDRGVSLDETDGSDSIKIPTSSDRIVGYPTQAGYYAWRNRERGSWYIEAIVQVFMKHAKHDDICTLLNRVNAVVSRKVSRASVKEMDEMSQMSEYKSSLRMPHVYLFPGIGSS